MNPFSQMIDALSTHHTPPWGIPEAGGGKQTSRTETIRELLRSATRPVTAPEIAFDVDLPSFNTNLVWLLLKHDISKGRVILQNGRYSWNHEYDSAQATAIRNAVQLLKRHGFDVEGPTV